MPTIFIPAMLRPMTEGQPSVVVDGRTLGGIIARLNERYPGLSARLVDGDRLASWLSVAVNGQLSPRGLHTAIPEDAEVHFLPAISGGAAS